MCKMLIFSNLCFYLFLFIACVYWFCYRGLIVIVVVDDVFKCSCSESHLIKVCHFPPLSLVFFAEDL